MGSSKGRDGATYDRDGGKSCEALVVHVEKFIITCKLHSNGGDVMGYFDCAPEIYP